MKQISNNFFFLGMLLTITLFTKKLKMNDMLIAAMACVFAIISRVWYAFVTSEILFWLGKFQE